MHHDVKLIVRHPDQTQREHALQESMRYSIGRAGCDISIEFEPIASREHATLSFEGGRWKLVDEMSSNGTFVAGKAVNFAWLEPGVTAHIGKTSLEIVSAPAAPIASAPPMAAAAAPQVFGGPAHQVATAPAATATRGRRRARGLSPMAAPVPPAGQRRAQAQVVVTSNAEPEGKQLSGGTVASLVAILLVVIVVVVVVSNAGGSGINTDSEMSRGSAVNQKALVATTISRQFETAKAESVLSLKVEALKAVHQAALAAPEIDDGFRRQIHTEMVQAEGELQRSISQDISPRLAKLRTLIASGDYREAGAQVALFDQHLQSQDERYQALLKAAGIYSEFETQRDQLSKLNADLLKRLKTEAEISEGMGWNGEAYKLYKNILVACLLTKAEHADFSKRVERLSDLPELHIVRREASARTSGPIIDTPGPENAINPGASRTPAATSKPTGEASSAPAAATAGSDVLLSLFPEGIETGETQAIIDMLTELRKALQLGKHGDNDKLQIAGKTHTIIQAHSNGLEVKYGKTGSPKMVGWKDLSIGNFLELLDRCQAASVRTLTGVTAMAFDRDELPVASAILVRIYELDNALKPAIDLWLARRRNMDVPEGGFIIFDGRFIAPDERDAMVRAARVNELTKILKKGMDSRNKQAQAEGEAAWEELLTLTPEAIKPTVEILEEYRVELREAAEKTTGLSKNTEDLKKLKEELNKRRAHALDLILDEQAWPYPYAPNDAEIREEVFKRVDAVREIWVTPHKVLGRANTKANEFIDKLRKVSERMDAIDPSFEFHQPTIDVDVDYLESVSNKALDIKNFALNGTEKTHIARRDEILEWNRATETQFSGKPEAPDEEAWRQLEITNDYRSMMGVLPMKMNFKLFWAAKLHSAWCMDFNGGRISHDSPGGPRGENPQQRAQYEGYGGGCGENIHMSGGGGPSPQSAHDSWLTSSGHHRNILNPNWTVMGNGRSRNIWTQVFGGSDEGESNTVSNGGAPRKS